MSDMRLSKTWPDPTVHSYGWLGGEVVRASDLWSTGCEFNSQPCTAGLVLGWATICGRVKHLGM